MQDLHRSLEGIRNARRFFAPAPPVETHTLAANALGGGTPFTGQAGLMKFVFNDQSISSDPRVVNKVNRTKYYLKGMMSLVTAKLFGDNKANVDAAFAVAPSAVKEIAVHLPLLSGFVSEEYKSSENTTVVALSTTLITAILDVSLDNYPGAIVKVQQFLQDTGKEIEVSAKVNQSTYHVTVFSGVIGVTKVGGIIDIEPAFQIAGASLSVTDIKTSVAKCMRAQSFTLNFSAPYFRAPFNYDVLEHNPTVREKMDKLITQGSVDQIDDSGAYFGL